MTQEKRRCFNWMAFGRSLSPSVLLLCGLLLLGTAAVRGAEDPPVRYSRGVLIRFEGPITPMLKAYFDRKLELAKAKGADLVVIEIESPGGFLDESEAIARTLLAVDWAHTVAYVPKQALSGAAIAALGIPSAWNTNFLGVVDTVANNLLLLGGGLSLSIFVGWVMEDPVGEVSVGTTGIRWFGLWRTLLRFVAPALLATALLQAIPSTWRAVVDFF